MKTVETLTAYASASQASAWLLLVAGAAAYRAENANGEHAGGREGEGGVELDRGPAPVVRDRDGHLGVDEVGRR